MPAQIKINSNHRILVTGKTGSGKTFLLKYLTSGVNRLVVLDGKGTLSNWNLEPWNNETRAKLIKGDPVRIRALPPWGENFAKFWDGLLRAVYRAGNCTIYIDELYAICPPNQKPLDILWSIYTRGREIGLGVWAGSQRPTWIPMFALSESEHFFMFRLQLEEDRKRMAAFMGEEVLKPIPEEHGFYYSGSSDNEPIYIPKLEVDASYIKPVNSFVQKPPAPAVRRKIFSFGGKNES